MGKKEKTTKKSKNGTEKNPDTANGHEMTLGDELLIQEFKRQERARKLSATYKAEKSNSKQDK